MSQLVDRPPSIGVALVADPAGTRPWMRSVALFTAGGASVIAGGIAAAVTGPAQWGHGSWVAAFLVLVAGAGQIGVGAGQAHVAPLTPSVTFTAVQCVMWNAGCAMVIAGTLLSRPTIVLVGSAPLMAVLVMSTVALRGSRAQRSAFLLLYRLLLVVLLASIPIGVALAWLRR